MESTYYNLLAPASYGGLSKFEPKDYTKKQVREQLQSQDTYTLLDDDFPGDALQSMELTTIFQNGFNLVYGFSGSGKIVFLQQRIQVLVDMYRRVIPICLGRSIDRQDGEDFKICVSGHF